ncbi:MAG: pyridoxal-phosphate dependent enzyme, partial [Myxococcota bacterium]
MPGFSLDDVIAAHRRIESSVVRTPTLFHQEGDVELYLKAESLQPIGAFKLRGAVNMLATLADDQPVVAHSSGNHAQAVARAAKLRGVDATIVMPNDAPKLKRARTEADGARVIEVGPDSAERVPRAP